MNMENSPIKLFVYKQVTFYTNTPQDLFDNEVMLWIYKMKVSSIFKENSLFFRYLLEILSTKLINFSLV